jgi:hypothetical protein
MVSRSATASASAGRRLITGPKKPNAGRGLGRDDRRPGILAWQGECFAGSLLADSRIGRSVFEGVSQFGWQACLGEDGTRKVRVPRYPPSAWPESLAVSNVRAPMAAYSGPTAARPCSALVRAATRGSFSPAA